MSDLTDFLLARLTEDERAADEADMVSWEQEEPVRADLGPLSPDRLRRDCKVKRAIVERHLATAPPWPDSRTQEIHETLADEVLPLLASLYAGHEDYRQEWRP